MSPYLNSRLLTGATPVDEADGSRAWFPQPPRALTGRQIKDWRAAHDITQAELSILLGVTVTTVSAWESDRASPPAYLSLALAELTRQLLRR